MCSQIVTHRDLEEAMGSIPHTGGERHRTLNRPQDVVGVTQKIKRAQKTLLFPIVQKSETSQAALIAPCDVEGGGEQHCSTGFHLNVASPCPALPAQVGGDPWTHGSEQWGGSFLTSRSRRSQLSSPVCRQSETD